MPWLALLLLLAPGEASEPVAVGLSIEAANRPLGMLPACEPGDAPSGWVQVGPLHDGEVPFRTSVELEFERLLLRPLSGTHGVGFSPTLHVDPALVAHADQLGANGSVAFDGELNVAVLGGAGETVPVTWSRGYDDRAANAEHLGETHRTVELTETGRRGPYVWTLTGTLTVDAHLWGRRTE